MLLYCSDYAVWHGRNSYKRTALLAQFIIHRGLIISFIQAVFSALFFYAAIAIFSGWLLVGFKIVFLLIFLKFFKLLYNLYNGPSFFIGAG